MVFKLTSFDKILERHSSSANSPDEKEPDICRNVSSAGSDLQNRDVVNNEYHMLPQNEVGLIML